MSIFNKPAIKLGRVAISVIVSALLSGCGPGRSEKGADTRVLARINNYELTVADFKSGIDAALVRRYSSEDPRKAKENLLENMIIKKILLEEAQKQNFDKDAAFMKEIERYWEQALLKLLLRKKEKELPGATPDEKGEALERWVADLRKEASVSVNRKLLDEIDIEK